MTEVQDRGNGPLHEKPMGGKVQEEAAPWIGFNCAVVQTDSVSTSTGRSWRISCDGVLPASLYARYPRKLTTDSDGICAGEDLGAKIRMNFVFRVFPVTDAYPDHTFIVPSSAQRDGNATFKKKCLHMKNRNK